MTDAEKAQTVPLKVVKKAINAVAPTRLQRGLGWYLNDEHADPEVVRLLLQCGACVEGWGNAGAHGHLEAIKIMLEFYNPRYRQPGDSISTGFSWACSHGHYKVAKYLIENAKFKIAQGEYEEALDHAIERRHKKIERLLESDEVKRRIHHDPTWD